MLDEISYIRSRKKALSVAIIVSLCLLLTTSVVVTGASNQVEVDVSTMPDTSLDAEVTVETIEPTIYLIDQPALCPNIEYIEPETDIVANERMEMVEQCVQMLDTECRTGDYTHGAIASMRTEIHRLEEIKKQYQVDLLKFERWKDEHYYAAMTWMYLRTHGCNEAVAAGIIGNMMAETSGGTLDLKPNIYSSGRYYYGLCQWSLGNRPHIAGMSFEDQLDYLIETMPKEFGYYAYIYKKGFTYEKFLELDDPEAVAHAFAKVYERCSSASYGARKRYAMKAYNYFTGE